MGMASPRARPDSRCRPSARGGAARWTPGGGEGNGAQDLRPHAGVDAHALGLFRREPAGLAQDVLGHGDLPDVVQQRRRVERLHLAGREREPASQLERVPLHAAQVLLRALVLGLDGQGQGFRDRAVERRGLLGVASLLVLAGEARAVGAVQQPDEGSGEREEGEALEADDDRQQDGERGPRRIGGDGPRGGWRAARPGSGSRRRARRLPRSGSGCRWRRPRRRPGAGPGPGRAPRAPRARRP